MKVTALVQQKKNPKRFNVFLDGQFAFGADMDLIVNRRIIKGKEIVPADLEKIIFEAEVGKLMEKMYPLFNIRMRSEKEIRDYFKRKNLEAKIKDKDEISEIAIEETINVLKRKGLLDDKVFAKAWVDARRQKKGMKVIKSELYQKGISREIIDEVLEDAPESDTGVAERLLEKRLQRWSALPPEERQKKAISFLLQRGFEYDLVKEVVKKLTLKYNHTET